MAHNISLKIENSMATFMELKKVLSLLTSLKLEIVKFSNIPGAKMIKTIA